MLFFTLLQTLLLLAFFIPLIGDILILVHECAHAAVAMVYGEKITNFCVYGTLVYFEYDCELGWSLDFFRSYRYEGIGGVVAHVGESNHRVVAAAGPFIDWFVAGLLIACAVFSFSLFVAVAATVAAGYAWNGFVSRHPGNDYAIMCGGWTAVEC